MTSVERFDNCRKRLWDLLSRTDMIDCKSYDGVIELTYCYPSYFDTEPKYEVPIYECVYIILHCYVIGPTRHYEFGGKTLNDAVDKFEEWIDAREREEANNDS